MSGAPLGAAEAGHYAQMLAANAVELAAHAHVREQYVGDVHLLRYAKLLGTLIAETNTDGRGTVVLEEAADHRADLVNAPKQDQVPAAPHGMQRWPRHQRRDDPVVHQRGDGVIVAGDDQCGMADGPQPRQVPESFEVAGLGEAAEGCRHQHQPANPAGVGERHLLCDRATERGAEHVSGLYAEFVESGSSPVSPAKHTSTR
jgi:hypothetical protein